MRGKLRTVYNNWLSKWLKPYVRNLVLRVHASFFRMRHPGSSYACNFCGFAAGLFLPRGIDARVLVEKEVVGGGYRENATCPRCRSIDRERLIKIVLDDHLNLDGGQRVLQVAPERSLNAYLRETCSGKVTECDLDPSAYEWAQDITRQDVTALEYAAESFDLVICNHVLEHVPDDQAALSELHRVLAPGGWAILQVPYCETVEATDEESCELGPQARLERFGQVDHVRLYQRDDFIRRAETAGFSSQVLEPSSFAACAQYAINPKESVFLFEKGPRW